MSSRYRSHCRPATGTASPRWRPATGATVTTMNRSRTDFLGHVEGTARPLLLTTRRDRWHCPRWSGRCPRPPEQPTCSRRPHRKKRPCQRTSTPSPGSARRRRRKPRTEPCWRRPRRVLPGVVHSGLTSARVRVEPARSCARDDSDQARLRQRPQAALRHVAGALRRRHRLAPRPQLRLEDRRQRLAVRRSG